MAGGLGAAGLHVALVPVSLLLLLHRDGPGLAVPSHALRSRSASLSSPSWALIFFAGPLPLAGLESGT